MANATLSFLPWVRQGAAAAIATADSPTTATQSAVATVAAAITLNDAAVPAPSIKLRGPADVIGVDTNQVVRTDPHPGTIDFEPNCFPSIEFDRPDFPWLFTPAKANDAKRLRPWLCLVVVQKQAGVTVSANVDARMATLTIAAPAKPGVELPDLKDSWAWAHAQVAADGTTTTAIDNAFAGGPELTLSRLVCPRILARNTDYIACVVPTFEVGRRSGLGIAVSDVDLGRIALAPAWVTTPAPVKVELPVFYQWEFRTGEQGDFESIARGLTSAVPEGLGKRPIDISNPCFNPGGATTAGLEGALIPIPSSTTPPPPAPDPIPLAFKNTLASIVNEPSRAQASDPNSDPLLAPPVYGRWHAGKGTAEPAGLTWLDQLNLDPRWRTVAAFGTRVVQEHQDALMASAWEQAAEVQAANQRLRQVQVSIAVGEVLHKRNLSVLSEEMVLRFAAPAFGRLRHPSGRSMLGNQAGSKLQPGANRSAMRRIGRLRGPLTRRTVMAGFPRSTSNTWVIRLNEMVPPPQYLIPLPPPPDLVPLPSIGLPPDGQSLYGAFFVAATNTTPAQQGPAVLDTSAIEAPDFFRSAAQEHLVRVFPPRPMVFRTNVILSTYPTVKQSVVDQMRPRIALPALVSAQIAKSDRVLKPTATGVPSSGAEMVMAPPYFPQPMYEPLRDISQDLLIPGLDTVKPETVLGLRTNRRFVESYMVGLNHEMGRELLWRGYPTDQRGTYFDRFWGQGVPNSAPKDITELHTWSIPDPRTGRIRALGDTQGAPPNSEEFVLLLRSVLLKRYPNAVIYMTPAIGAGPANPAAFVPDVTPANEVRPIFSGSLKPDVVFLGFPVTGKNAVGGPGVGNGYFVIIQEHPTEARFGIDDGLTLNGASHLVVGPRPPDGLDLQGGNWNTHAADMARVTRRLPARIAIHASRLITPA